MFVHMNRERSRRLCDEKKIKDYYFGFKSQQKWLVADGYFGRVFRMAQLREINQMIPK